MLDEPTRGIDGLRKLALVELVRTLAAQGTAVVVVTHDMDFAAEAADVVTTMAAGRVLADRAPRDSLAPGMFFVSQLGLALGRASLADAVALLTEPRRRPVSSASSRSPCSRAVTLGLVGGRDRPEPQPRAGAGRRAGRRGRRRPGAVRVRSRTSSR